MAEQDTLPRGWMLNGNKAACYRVGVDRAVTHAGGAGSGFLRWRDPGARSEPGWFGTLMQDVVAGPFGGQRVRLAGWVRIEDVVPGSASLWLRADDDRQRIVAFDNMSNRLLTGSADWTELFIVLDIPAEAKSLHFGLILEGPGAAWVDDLRLEIVDRSVPTTAASRIPHATPQNLGFDET